MRYFDYFFVDIYPAANRVKEVNGVVIFHINTSFLEYFKTGVVDIGDLIVDWYETCLEPGELITSILLPAPMPGYSSYRKVARVSGDYAVASCAISIGNNGSGRVGIAIGGCGPAPVRVRDAEPLLSSGLVNQEDVDALCAALVARADPVDDVRGSAEYRRNLIPRLVGSAIAGIQQAEVA